MAYGMEPVSSKVTEEVRDELDDYADEHHDGNRSDAIKHLLRVGLEKEQTPDHITLPTGLAIAGLFLFLGAYAEVSIEPVAGNVGGLLVLIALLIQYRPVTDYLRHVVGRIRSTET